VLIVCPSNTHLVQLSRRLVELLSFLTHRGDVTCSGISVVQFTPSMGQALFTTIENLEWIRGLTLDEVYSDPGQLEPLEFAMLAPMMKYSVPEFPDISYIETEYEIESDQGELELVPQEADKAVEPPVKESGRVRRKISSR
jgi:hypothetical protein